MIDTETQKKLLRKRVEALQFDEGVFIEADKIIQASGMKLTDASKILWREWLNDLVATTHTAEFRRASGNPKEHFLSWVAERAKKPFHVTYRAIDAVERRFGSDLASRYAHIVWPQEIAWAQRLRLSENPNIATRAAMFLREIEGNPARLFSKIADLYADAIAKVGYTDSPAHELSPNEIRFNQVVPEFNPLFLKYASRQYTALLNNMTRERIELLGSRAAKDEKQDRSIIMARKVVTTTKRFPMRRLPNVISLAKSLGLNSNQLFQLETSFLNKMEAGEIELEQGLNSPHIAFVTALTNDKDREELLALAPALNIDQVSCLWEVAHLDGRRWVNDLPESFSKWADISRQEVEKWQLAIVEERREAPIDLISDFAFWLLDVGV